MLVEFKISQSELDKYSTNSLEEKVYNIVGQSFDEQLNSDGKYSKWDIHDIKDSDDGVVAVLKVEEAVKTEVENVVPCECATEYVDAVEAQDSSCCGCVDVECSNECSDECCNNDVDVTIPAESVAFNGPWSDKVFSLDITQMAAVFEVIQFCDYMVKRTQMVTPVAARSLQECQKFILENLTDFSPEQAVEIQSNPTQPVEIKIKDEFAEHLKKWQEECVAIFEKLVSEMQRKPQIVTANMVPQAGFDPRGPG